MSFVRTLRQNWELGQCGNDIIIFIDANSKKLYVSVGSATEERLTENRLYEIRRNVRKYMLNGRFFDALKTILDDLLNELDVNEFIKHKKELDKLNEIEVGGLVSVMLGVAVVISCCACITFTLVARSRSNKPSSKVVDYGEPSVIDHKRFTDVQQY